MTNIPGYPAQDICISRICWEVSGVAFFGFNESSFLRSMQTTDASLLFQTNSQLEHSASHDRKLAASAGIGAPINLAGKVLDFEILGSEAWTAESGWQSRCVDLLVSSPISVSARRLVR